ncbi:hypothetical protein VTJ83DRAFT_3330 [Remersonia thermophila]|uniref:Uncharacterized protein n=1 Tax=Remersonia thermophila TaxID=72144 RepID=A0ABR4DG03_9PEZI
MPPIPPSTASPFAQRPALPGDPRRCSNPSHTKTDRSPALPHPASSLCEKSWLASTLRPPGLPNLSQPHLSVVLSRSRQAQHSLAVASRWPVAPSRQLPNSPLPIPANALPPPTSPPPPPPVPLLPEQAAEVPEEPRAAGHGCSEMRTVSSRAQRPQMRTWVV